MPIFAAELNHIHHERLGKHGAVSVARRCTGPDSQDAEVWLDEDTFVSKGNIFTINADGKVERKDKPTEEMRTKVQRMSAVYQERAL